MPSVELESRGKVNLGLRVVGKRDDGYHNIETVFSTIELKDQLTIEESNSGIEVHADGRGVPEGKENLAYAAAERTLGMAGNGSGIRVTIKKEIPAGGGLGGASSNAAAVIVGANQLLELGLAETDLYKIARSVGSDVPFFIRGGSALATGRGDRLQFFDAGMSVDLVIVFPGFPISTSWAYSKVDSGLTPEWFDIKILASALEQGDLSSLCKRLYNSFEDIVFESYPALFEIKNKMIEFGAVGSLLSGSGSCLFGIALDAESGAELAARLGREGLTVWKTATC